MKKRSGPDSGYAAQVGTEVAKSQEMERIKEYENFYLYGKFKNGKLLYRECFLKQDIDGVQKHQVRKRPYNSFSRRGW